VPLLLLAIALVLTPVVLVPVSLVLRYRAGTARRQARGWIAVLNLIGLAVSTMLFLMGATIANIWVPHTVSYSLLGLVPILSIVRWAKTLENATDYSLQNTVRQALFLPTSREAKYKAKAAIDTFFMRSGDVLQAGIVRLGASVQLGLTGFAWVNVGLTLAWLYSVSRLAREHRKMGF